jgi:hypothetical protein
MNNSIVLVASLAFVLTAINQVVVLPTGIRTIMKEQLPSSSLIVIHAFGLLMYMGWCLYGCIKGDPAMIIGCGLGVICSGALLACTILVLQNKKKYNIEEMISKMNRP